MRGATSNVNNEMGSPHTFLIYVCRVKISRQLIMDPIEIVGWILLGILLYYALKPLYEDFQIDTNTFGLSSLGVTNKEVFYLQFGGLGGIWPQLLRIGGTEIAGATPWTCRPDRDSLEDGLCYVPCKKGYTGFLTTCRADSMSVGVGTPVALEDCPAGWTNDGLTCREPLSGGGCRTWCDGNWDWADGGFCHTRCDPIRGGAVKGRLDGGGKCPGPGGDEYTDKVDGLCYKTCPKDKPYRIPGMPYLCYAGGDLVYDRGAGTAPPLLSFFRKYYF